MVHMHITITITAEAFKGWEGVADPPNFSLSSGEYVVSYRNFWVYTFRPPDFIEIFRSSDFCSLGRKSQASPLITIYAHDVVAMVQMHITITIHASERGCYIIYLFLIFLKIVSFTIPFV
ncbi:hypothetical protein HanRHA438_Chr15g0695521 [Helianthus annuus]|nr:hypothetical protein HanRHA438_Chr15g0695521 [Helianthus annuus]